MVSLELDAKFDSFIKLRESIFYYLQKFNISNNSVSEVLLVAEEIFTNIIRHSYKGECNEPIFVTFYVSNSTLYMTFKDKGEKAEELKIPNSLIELQGKVGGLGLYLISKLSDSYGYKHSGNWNINFIEKDLT
ncbi:MAG: ATP-binding protein [Spirochaetes bacterium]|nr:ATP-binding protein [Spirochaetota bacterium]NLJ04940.1 ATP-binding protein [Exilispira sp.]HNV44223.1 ATP-binding protein [Exilispira sp.]HPB48005.1 ATP-binding protein [Exilispira sp.]HQJ40430.1 ATP-binding protein [Exilispira sp.]